MKKTFLKLGLGALLATNALLYGEAVVPFTGVVLAAEATGQAATPAEAKTIQGKIANISQKAKTIALSTPDGQFFLMKFTDATILKDVESAADFKEDEAIIALYTISDGENIATSLAKDVVKLPEGIKEIKTDELAGLLSTDKNVVIVDSRPTARFDDGHIPGAVSIPFADLVAKGDEGAKLLAPFQDRQLVFYCGGST
jgi:predicted sulfurtransferase